MLIKDLLDDAAGGDAVRRLSAAFGLDPVKAEIAVGVMGQALVDRIERNTLSRGGLADIVDILARPGTGRALSDPENLAAPQVAAIGNAILSALVGDRHASRGIAARAARESGADEETLKKMLPVVASMLIGAVQHKAMPTFEDTVSRNPSLRLSEVRAGSPLPLPGEALPAPGSGWDVELPRPAGGSGGGMGGTVGRSPLPVPGDTIPGIDEPSRFPKLPDIVRKGGRQIQIPMPGGNGGGGSTGSLDDFIRQILANVLGFKNGGIMSWIIKYVLYRVVSSILRRIFGGR